MNDPQYSLSQTRAEAGGRYTGFWPLTLLALSFGIIMGRELMVSADLRTRGAKLKEQQVRMVEQSRRTQAGLEKLARDLIEVSKTDEEASAIVKKYAITMNSPAPGSSPAAASAASSASPSATVPH
jgi:hypothetical protein